MNANHKINKPQNSLKTVAFSKEEFIDDTLLQLLVDPTPIALNLDAPQWKRAINDTYFDLSVRFQHPNKFLGYLQHTKLLDIGVSHYHASTVHYGRGLQNQNCNDDSILITFPIQGQVHFKQNERQLICHQGEFFIELSNLPYELYHLNDAALYVIKVPLSLLTPHLGIIERQFARTLTVEGGASRLLFFQMTQILQLMQCDKLVDLEIRLLEEQLLNLIILMLGSPLEIMSSNTSSIKAVHLKRIEHYVHLNLNSPSLSPQKVADACYISVRYLHTLFIDLPYTFSEWLKSIRLEHANAILQKQNYVTIDEVAYRVGYNDQSYFSRIYKQYFGYSPRDTPKTFYHHF